MSGRATSRAAPGMLAALLFPASLVGLACGSKSGTSQALDTKALATQLRGVKKGEVLIIGRRPVRFGGPYSFRRGGYVFRFTQAAREDGARPRLRVTLESRRGSRTPPYQRLVDTDRPQGRVRVTIGGRLFVHVVTNSPSYVLRFTPRVLNH
jgi:hypothetical protein